MENVSLCVKIKKTKNKNQIKNPESLHHLWPLNIFHRGSLKPQLPKRFELPHTLQAESDPHPYTYYPRCFWSHSYSKGADFNIRVYCQYLNFNGASVIWKPLFCIKLYCFFGICLKIKSECLISTPQTKHVDHSYPTPIFILLFNIRCPCFSISFSSSTMGKKGINVSQKNVPILYMWDV